MSANSLIYSQGAKKLLSILDVEGYDLPEVMSICLEFTQKKNGHYKTINTNDINNALTIINNKNKYNFERI